MSGPKERCPLASVVPLVWERVATSIRSTSIPAAGEEFSVLPAGVRQAGAAGGRGRLVRLSPAGQARTVKAIATALPAGAVPAGAVPGAAAMGRAYQWQVTCAPTASCRPMPAGCGGGAEG